MLRIRRRFENSCYILSVFLADGIEHFRLTGQSRQQGRSSSSILVTDGGPRQDICLDFPGRNLMNDTNELISRMATCFIDGYAESAECRPHLG